MSSSSNSFFQEMSSERCPLLRNTKSGVLKYLVIEQTPWEKTRKYFLREGKEEELVVVPYPSYGHLQRYVGQRFS